MSYRGGSRCATASAAPPTTTYGAARLPIGLLLTRSGVCPYRASLASFDRPARAARTEELSAPEPRLPELPVPVRRGQ